MGKEAVWPPSAGADEKTVALWQALCRRHGEVTQRKLAAAQVAIAGLGGLGSNVAVHLARIGVGRLRLIDFDTVDMTNLNRQYYFLAQVGQLKTEALRQTLAAINPAVAVDTVTVRVTPASIRQLFDGWPIVCEAFDEPSQKAMLVRQVRRQLPETIVVSGNGMAGYGGNNEMRTRSCGRHLYICGDGHSGNDGLPGLMAPRVALCAAQMANTVTKVLLDGQAAEDSEE